MFKKIFSIITIMSISLCFCNITFAEEVLHIEQPIKKQSKFTISGIKMEEEQSLINEENKMIISNVIIEKENTKNNTVSANFYGKEVKKLQMWTDYVSYFENVEDLTKESDYIVKATILPESENFYFRPLEGHTKTKIQINEVYKGNINKNEIVTLMEPYYYCYDEEDDIIYEFHSELYDKSEVGKEYILFLIKSRVKDSNCYYLVNEYYGRYPAPSKDRPVAINEELKPEFFNLYDGYIEDYKKIYKEIVKIYQDATSTNKAISSPKIQVVISEHEGPLESISDIEVEAEYIVKGKILEGSENILYTEHGGGYTKTNLEITDVYKGNLGIGDIIPLIELYYTEEDGTEVQRNGYSASIPGKEYLFYIVKYDNGTYGIVCTIFGRYLLDDTQTLSNDSIEANVAEEYAPLYNKLKTEVMNIYSTVKEV